MKSIYSMMAALGLAFFVCAPASAATTDPEIILYRGTGLNTNGAQSTLQCTPFSGVSENIRMVIRDTGGNLISNSAATIAHLATFIITTSAGGSGGTVAIAATSNQVVCTVSVEGTFIHMIRFNLIPGTAE